MIVFAISFSFALSASKPACAIANYIALETPIPNVDISIPASGSLQIGSHTVSLFCDTIWGFSLTMSSTSEDTSLNGISGLASNDAISTIKSPGLLENNTWGYSLDNQTYYPIAKKNNPSIIADSTGAITAYRNVNVHYGVRLDDPTVMVSRVYVATIQYTATAKLPASPIITKVTPSTFETNSSVQGNNKMTIIGINLTTAHDVYIGWTGDEANKCTNLIIVSGTELTCYVPTKLKPGVYTVSVITHDGIATLGDAVVYVKPSKCRSGDLDNTCQVDIDDNMIPIRYDDNSSNSQWVSISKNEIQDVSGIWYDYNEKQWANAVTVKPESLSKYQNKSVAIDNNDVLGYWVYIPRYAYEVMRPNAVDRVVTDTQAKSEGGFDIRFETANDIKKIPHPTCNILNPTATQMWQDGNPSNNTIDNVLAKDYRTECTKQLNFSRTYPGNTIGSSQADKQNNTNTDTTWATHPAFTWTYPKEVYPELSINGQDKVMELNGIWIGKFETTGTRSAPTIKPNQHANIEENIGEFYNAAKSLGKLDSNNTGGGAEEDDTTPNLVQNSHNMASSTTHMLKNSEWGAIAYLSASKNGAGIGRVWNNAAFLQINDKDADGDTGGMGGVTGCGPNGTSEMPADSPPYENGTPLNDSTTESPTACSTITDRSYTSDIGQLASTTNNIYGIYDMSGGAYEYVMGNRTTNAIQTTSSTSSMKTPASEPYVDLYKTLSAGGPFSKPQVWSSSVDELHYNNDACTWLTCGGHALHEIKVVQSVTIPNQSWTSDISLFVSTGCEWSLRGDFAGGGQSGGVFTHSCTEGEAPHKAYYGFRATAVVN